jgi:hypothetical protein
MKLASRWSTFVPIVAVVAVLIAVLALGGIQTNAATRGIVAKAPIHTPAKKFGAPAAARNNMGCPIQCAPNRFMVEHFDGQVGTENSQLLCLPLPAWNLHCNEEVGTTQAGHEQDDCFCQLE